MTSFRTLGLRTALALYVLLPIVSAMSVAAVFAVGGLERQMERRMQEDVELVARSIQRPLAHALERGREGAVQNALDSAFRIDRVFGAYVYDAEGRPVAGAGRSEEASARRLGDLAARGERIGEYGEVAGRKVYSYFVPLIDAGGQVSALLQVTRRASDFEAYFRRLRWQAGAVLTASWLAVGGLMLTGHRKVIGRPLERLLGSMNRVAEGDRAHRADAHGPLEVVNLAAGLNSMLDSIETAEREIVERRRHETALREELRHSERLAAVGRLSAGVAHELGAPLSVISGRVQRALRSEDPGSPASVPLEEIARQVRRMESVVWQLLDFGRRGSGETRRTEVSRVCQAAAVAAQDSSSGAEVVLRGPTEGVVVELDAGRLERVLINLLRNAVQASPESRAELSWAREAGRLRLIVDDDGAGVEDADRERIFEPFFTTKPHGEGSGLGLAVVHGLVGELGGRIRIGESPLGGARFEVTLPGPRG